MCVPRKLPSCGKYQHRSQVALSLAIHLSTHPPQTFGHSSPIFPLFPYKSADSGTGQVLHFSIYPTAPFPLEQIPCYTNSYIKWINICCDTHLASTLNLYTVLPLCINALPSQYIKWCSGTTINVLLALYKNWRKRHSAIFSAWKVVLWRIMQIWPRSVAAAHRTINHKKWDAQHWKLRMDLMLLLLSAWHIKEIFVWSLSK